VFNPGSKNKIENSEKIGKGECFEREREKESVTYLGEQNVYRH